MPNTALRPAIFLDRDGVLIENKDAYVRSVGEAVPLPGAIEALGRLCRDAPATLVIVVTNQAGVGRGIINQPTVDAIHGHLRMWVRAAGGRIDAIYTCPDRNDQPSRCRKPAPGMLLQAAREWGVDRPASVMIGDALSDVQAGRAAGVRAWLLRTGRGAEQAELLPAAGLADTPTFADLAAAIDHYLTLAVPRP